MKGCHCHREALIKANLLQFLPLSLTSCLFGISVGAQKPCPKYAPWDFELRTGGTAQQKGLSLRSPVAQRLAPPRRSTVAFVLLPEMPFIREIKCKSQRSLKVRHHT